MEPVITRSILRKLGTRVPQKVRRNRRGCWLWTGYQNEDGYGKIKRNNKNIKVHRAVFEAAYGDIPEGLVVCHKCDVRNCCNPAHLYVDTQRANVQDMVDKGRAAWQKRNA